MAAIDDGHNELHVSSFNSTFSSPNSALPNLTPLNADRKSSLPKGCRFRDLGEAHRNITGRSISASHGAEGLAGSASGSTDNSGMDSPFRDAAAIQDEEDDIQQDFHDSQLSPRSMDFLNDLGNPEDLLDKIFDRKGTRSCSPAMVSTPASKKESKESRSPLVRHFSDENVSPRAVRNSQGPDRSSDSHMAMTVYSTDTTVGRMYTQYQTHILNPLYANNSSPVPVIPHIVRPRDGAVNRLGFGPDDRSSPPCGDLAVRPLPSVNVQRPQDGISKTPGGTPADSPKRGSLFLSVPTRESLLYPKPLRVQSMRVEGKHTSLHSGIAASAAGMTTDSEEDPFRYDKDAYNVFLHPSKERDISAALNQISGVSSLSRATLCTQGDDLPARKLSLRPPPIPKEYLDDPFLTGPTRARSPTPESADGFYDTSVIQPNWAVERSAYEVKVVLQDVSNNQNVNTGRRSKNRDGSTAMSEKTLPVLAQPPFQAGGLYRRGKENMPSSERDDWETVATTAPGFGSTGLHPPIGRGLEAINSRGAKITGSSLADVSDDNSFRNVPFDEYASTDRIVQHPSGHEDSEESLQIHHISGTKVPVMVPKQRVHRVNGYPQNSSRMYPTSQRSGSEAAAALARKVSSPFRQLSGRRPHKFSPMPLQPPPFKLQKGRKKFEFRHQSQGSDKDPFFTKGGVYEFQGVSSEAGNTRSATNDNTVSELDDRLGDGHSLRDSGSSQSSNSTIHSFPFPLIPLPEAARKQAFERATTGTESSAADTFWARNAANKKRPLGSEHIRLPEPTHQRVPVRFPSFFASSSTRSSNRSNRLKKRRTLPKDLTMQSALSSTTAGGTWATILPIGSTSNRHGGPTHMLKSAATRLHLDDLARRFQERKKPSFTMGSSLISRSSQPRLYPWDYQARRRQQRARGTDPELRAIALGEPGCGRDLERNGVPLDPEAFITHEGRWRRRNWFYCMLAVSMFPFISVMVYLGKFDSGLSWYSCGEVDRLNTQQRRVILVVMVAQFVFWPIILGLVIWRAQQLD